MTSSASDFHVDIDRLHAVGDQVKSLLDDIAGNHGYTRGNSTDFQQAADITPALALFYGSNHDPFSAAYGYEFKAITGTYQALINQLTNLTQAIQQTAANYDAQEAASKLGIQQSAGG